MIVQHNCEENGSVDDESASRASSRAEEDDDEDGDSEDLNEVADRAALSEHRKRCQCRMTLVVMMRMVKIRMTMMMQSRTEAVPVQQMGMLRIRPDSVGRHYQEHV